MPADMQRREQLTMFQCGVAGHVVTWCMTEGWGSSADAHKLHERHAGR